MKNLSKKSGSRSNKGDKSLDKSDLSNDGSMPSSTFLSTVRHELRSPITSILGFTSLILNDKDSEISDEHREYLTIVYGSARDLLNLIGDVMDISMIEADKMELINETFLLDDAIYELIATFEGELMKKGLQYKVDIPPDIQMFQDKQRFTQVLANLISNSIKFANSGIIEITGNKTGNDIQVSVKDSGIGIKQEDIPKLFEPFPQIYTNMQDKPKGTGLGLYLCYKIVNLMQGRIWAESEFGKGSIFSFNVPIECTGM